MLDRILILLVLCLGQAHAAEQIQFESEPDWITSAQPSLSHEVPTSELRDGVYYRLYDRQIRVPAEGEVTYYYRFAIQITNLNGLDDQSQINVDFDPVYEQLQFHRLNVIRDGETINRLQSTPLRMLNREEELDYQLYNGLITANFLLSDLRVGDVIDYSYSVRGRNPVFDGMYSDSFRLHWSVPIELASLRLLWEKNKPLYVKGWGTEAPVQRTQTSSGEEFLLVEHNLQPVSREDDVPNWASPYGRLFFSEHESWDEVVDWGIGLFRNSILQSEEIEQVVDRIRATTSNPSEQIVEVLQYVQDQIRYVGIELGVNSHQPSPAPTVLSRRYGDCKDKTSLMIALLHELGIDAHPALVNTRRHQKIAEVLPSTSVFNHVLVALPHDGETYWLDPTRTYQRGQLHDIYEPDYGYALVLREGEDKLTEMLDTGRGSGFEVTEHFDFTDTENESVKLSVTTEYFGENSERKMRRFDRDSLKDITQDYVDWYQRYYPKIWAKEDVHGYLDEERLRYKVEESYQIDEVWRKGDDDGREFARVYASTIESYLDSPDKQTRQQIYDLGKPVHLIHRIRLNLFDRYWNFQPFEFREDNAFFYFYVKESFDADKAIMSLLYEYRRKVDHVLPTDFPDYLAALDRANEHISFGFYRTGVEPTSETDHSDTILTVAMVCYFSLLPLVFVLWRRNLSRDPFKGEMSYYPIEQVQFIFMWLFTLGLYPVYWCYRLWSYERSKTKKYRSVPALRGFFYYLWFYPACRALSVSMQEAGMSDRLPPKTVFVLLSIAILAVNFVPAFYEEAWIPMIFIAPLLFLPLLSMVNSLNEDQTDAIDYNSRLKPRHALLVLFCLPIYIYSTGLSLGFLPEADVVAGDSLIDRDLQFMQQNGIVDSDDRIVYFYSDAFWSKRDDGNGFSQRHVFSYWKDDNDRLRVETVDFKDIWDIEVEWSRDSDENTIVEVYRQNLSKVVLYVAKSGGEDRVFVRDLKARWQQSRSSSN